MYPQLLGDIGTSHNSQQASGQCVNTPASTPLATKQAGNASTHQPVSSNQRTTQYMRPGGWACNKTCRKRAARTGKRLHGCSLKLRTKLVLDKMLTAPSLFPSIGHVYPSSCLEAKKSRSDRRRNFLYCTAVLYYITVTVEDSTLFLCFSQGALAPMSVGAEGRNLFNESLGCWLVRDRGTGPCCVSLLCGWCICICRQLRCMQSRRM